MPHAEDNRGGNWRDNVGDSGTITIAMYFVSDVLGQWKNCQWQWGKC